MSNGLEHLTRQEIRDNIEEMVQNAYREGWRESRRWPNHPDPPELEIIWGTDKGLLIREIPR